MIDNSSIILSALLRKEKNYSYLHKKMKSKSTLIYYYATNFFCLFMEQFMTLRRLNLKIQGFPESYASEPYGEDMVVGEPQQSSMTSPAPQSRQQQQQQQQHGDVLNDSVADAAIQEDPITGAT